MSPVKVTRGGWRPSGVAAERRTANGATVGKAARTRAIILDAARAEFDRRGFAATTVEHIVERAGVARGSFYTYFESKKDLFAHLTAQIDRDVRTNVVGGERRGDPIENLRASNRAYLEMVRANADLYRLVEEVAVLDEDVRAARSKSRQDHVARVAGSIRRWQRRGWADPTVDPAITAAALVAMLSGFAQWFLVQEDRDGDADAERVMTDIWVRACRLQPPESS